MVSSKWRQKVFRVTRHTRVMRCIRYSFTSMSTIFKFSNHQIFKLHVAPASGDARDTLSLPCAPSSNIQIPKSSNCTLHPRQETRAILFHFHAHHLQIFKSPNLQICTLHSRLETRAIVMPAILFHFSAHHLQIFKSSNLQISLTSFPFTSIICASTPDRFSISRVRSGRASVMKICRKAPSATNCINR